jgi:hypothetical protein
VSRGRAAAIERLKHIVEAADAICAYAGRGREAAGQQEPRRLRAADGRTLTHCPLNPVQAIRSSGVGHKVGGRDRTVGTRE